MGIDKIKLGPRSRVLEKQSREYEEAVEKVISEALVSPAVKAKLEKAKVDLVTQGSATVEITEDDFQAMHPPLPGPANPQSLRGCGCGKFHIPPGTPDAGIEIDGAVHRYSKPCYSQYGEEERVYYKVKAKTPSLEDRVIALEKVVAGLLAAQETP